MRRGTSRCYYRADLHRRLPLAHYVAWYTCKQLIYNVSNEKSNSPGALLQRQKGHKVDVPNLVRRPHLLTLAFQMVERYLIGHFQSVATAARHFDFFPLSGGGKRGKSWAAAAAAGATLVLLSPEEIVTSRAWKMSRVKY